MGKEIGMLGLFGGIVFFLYNWVKEQKVFHSRLEEMIVFLQKSIFAMEEEKVYIINYFEGYRGRDEFLMKTLQEIAHRLRKNIYPNGQTVWEEVFLENRSSWKCNEEIFGEILSIGNGFFGKKRNENLCFLRKSLNRLENLRDRQKEKDAQERKVWIPVGMLSGIMLMIILI